MISETALPFGKGGFVLSSLHYDLSKNAAANKHKSNNHIGSILVVSASIF